MTIEHGALVVSITWLAVISPGADFAIITRNSTLHGRGAGIISAGLRLLSACGLRHVRPVSRAALYSRSVLLHSDRRSLLSGVPGAYNRLFGFSHRNDTSNGCAYKPWRYYATAFLTNSLNPKTSVFVISLYTQVIGIQTSPIGQIGWGAFISLSHFIWFALVACFVHAENPAFLRNSVFSMGLSVPC